MTRHLPEEILLLVFQDVDRSDLLNCQQVCRFWYPPAHMELLKDIQLMTIDEIDQFIASFDINPSQAYFNAVKSIEIWRKGGAFSEKMSLERATVEKLFYRFPNLQKVVLDHANLVANFDEEICQEILLRCPQLDTFEVLTYQDPEPDFRSLLLKVKTLLTHTMQTFENCIPYYDDAVEFMGQFQRAKTLSCDEVITSVDLLLPVLEHLPHINTVELQIRFDLGDNFGVNHLSVDSRDVVVRRLSNITKLTLNAECHIPNTLKFVGKYFTGLKSLRVGYDLSDWQRSLEDLLYVNTFDAIHSLNGDWSMGFDETRLEVLLSSFPSLIQNMFQKVPSALRQPNSRVLQLTYGFGSARMIRLALDGSQSPINRNVSINVSRQLGIDNIIFLLFRNDVCLDEVDVFKLTFTDQDYKQSVSGLDAPTYLKLLATMPSLTQVHLDIPAPFVRTQQEQGPYTGPVLTRVQTVTLSGAKLASMQSLLNSCRFAFPNLKELDIDNFCGEWQADVGEFQLDLKDYSLDQLTLDVSQVTRALDSKKIEHFALEVETLDSNEKHSYIISHDLSSSKMTRNCRLTDYKRRDGYLCIRLTAKYLKLVMFRALNDSKTKKCSITLE